MEPTIHTGDAVTVVSTGEEAHVVEIISNFIYPDHEFYVLDIEHNGAPAIYHEEGLTQTQNDVD